MRLRIVQVSLLAFAAAGPVAWGALMGPWATYESAMAWIHVWPLLCVCDLAALEAAIVGAACTEGHGRSWSIVIGCQLVSFLFVLANIPNP